MIIEQLHLKAFGRFDDQTIDLNAGPRRFHLVYGPNESGKSTCLRAISALLYGIPRTTPDNYLHGNTKMRVGATLYDDAAGRLGFVRRKGTKGTLLSADGETPADESQLALMLGGINEEAFHHRFGLSHDQLVLGGKLVLESKGELGEILFAAGAGVGRLKAIQSQLDDEAKSLFLERGKKTINLLIKEFEEKRKELRVLQTPPAEYKSLKSQLADAEAKSEDLIKQSKETTRDLVQNKAFRDAQKIVPIWNREKARLGELTDVPTLDQDFAVRRREAQLHRKNYSRQVDELEQKLESITTGLAQSPVDSATIENEREIVALFQAIAAREAASSDQKNLQRVAGNHNRHLRELLRDLEIGIDPAAEQDEIDRHIEPLHVSDATQIHISELAGNYELLRQQERDALENLQTSRKQLAELDDELSHTPSAADPSTLDAVLTEVGSPSALRESEDQHRETCSDLASQCERLKRDLNIDSVELSDAVVLPVPDVAKVDAMEERLTQSQRSKDEAQKNLTLLSEKHQLSRETLDQLQSDARLPTEQELTESRLERDQLIDQVDDAASDAASVRKTNVQVRKSVQQSDDVVDTIRSHQEMIARRSAAQKELARLERAIVDAQNQAEAAETQLTETEAGWKALWEPCDVIAGSVRSMRSWLATHASLVEKLASLRQSEERLASSHDRIQRVRSRLAAAIERAWSARPVAALAQQEGPDDVAGLELEQLHDAATALRSDLNSAASQVELRRRKLSELQTQIPRLEAKHESAQEKRKAWDLEWKLAIRAISDDETVSPSVVSTRLKKVEKLFQEKRERDIVQGRIKSIDHDDRSFTERVQVAARLVSLDDSDDRRSVEVAQMLFDRLTKATRDSERHQTLQSELTECKRKLESDMNLLQAATNQLSELCREANVDSDDQLADLEDLSAEKRRIAQSIDAAEKQLALISGNDSIDAFAAMVESKDPIDLDSEIAELERLLNSLTEQSSAAQQQVGAIKKELSAIDGGDRAAELNQDMQMLSGRIERASQRYAKARIASMILRQAIEHYRSENESPVLKLACEAFHDLTCGRYTGLRPEYDDKGRSKLFGVESLNDGQENLVPVDALSLGTADALFLAMRLASLEHQLSAGHAIPVVIDDCLIQLDDERTIAALNQLSKLSERTQVILFTHHQHLVELAKSSLGAGEFHLQQLA